MKKLATALVFVLLIVGILGSLTMAYVSTQIESTYTGFVQHVNTTSNAELRLTNFEQGMLRSRANLKMDLSLNVDLSLKTVHSHLIHHGPILPQSDCGETFGLLLIEGDSRPVGDDPRWQHFFKGRPLTTDCIFVDFAGVTHGRSVIPGYDGPDFSGDGATLVEKVVAWEPVTVTWTLDQATGKTTMGLNAPVFSYSGPVSTAVLNGINATAERKMVGNQLVDGDMSFSIGSVRMSEIVDGIKSSTELKGFRIDGSSKVKAQTVDVGVGIAFDEVEADANSIVGRGNYRMSVTDLSRQGLEGYWEQIRDLEQQETDAADFTQKSIALFTQFLPDMAASSPTFNFDSFSQETKDGRLSLNGHVRFHGEGFYQLTDTAELVSRLELDLHMDLSKAALTSLLAIMNKESLQKVAADSGAAVEEIENFALESAGASLSQMVAMGILIEQGESFACNILIKNGVITINGAAANALLEELMQRMGETT